MLVTVLVSSASVFELVAWQTGCYFNCCVAAGLRAGARAMYYVCRTMVPDAAPDRGSQRLSLRISQTQQLKRGSLFEGFTYEPTQQSLAAAGGHLHRNADLSLSESDDD